jgi:hypothetical protein
MKIEIPDGALIFMVVIINAILLVGLAGFINLNYIIKDLKNSLAKIMIDQKHYEVNLRE